MGIETALMIGLSVASAASGMSAAKKQAKALVEQGNYELKNKARETALRAAKTQVSFLNSGLTLEGTPMNVIQGQYDLGLEDMRRISSNYNNQSKNIISQARTQAISSLASSFGSMSFGGGASGNAGGLGGVNYYGGERINWNGYGGFY